MRVTSPWSTDENLSPTDRDRLERLGQILEEAQAEYEFLFSAETVTSAEDGVVQGFGRLASMAPTFLLQTEWGWLCAIISGETRLAYKKIRKQLGVKDVALARPDIVFQVTGARPGSMALVNTGFVTIIDQRLTLMDSIYGGCGVPQYTLHMGVRDLIAVTQAQVFDFAEPKTAV